MTRKSKYLSVSTRDHHARRLVYVLSIYIISLSITNKTCEQLKIFPDLLTGCIRRLSVILYGYFNSFNNLSVIRTKIDPLPL